MAGPDFSSLFPDIHPETNSGRGFVTYLLINDKNVIFKFAALEIIKGNYRKMVNA